MGNDILTGGSFALLFGISSEQDILLGGAGNDSLTSVDSGTVKMNGYGGTAGEIDTLNCSGCTDIILLGQSNSVFYQGTGYALIKKFTAGQDRIQLERTEDYYKLSVEPSTVGSTSKDDTVLRRKSNNNVIAVFSDTNGLALNSGNFDYT